MSILIKDMEMPTSCGYCPFKYLTMEGDECMFNARSTEYQKRPDDCPLVYVPPHGRLIDADALFEHMETEADNFNPMNMYDDGLLAGYNAAIRTIRDRNIAPTIIPAGGGE